MKMIMLLLVSTLALMVNSASVRPRLSGHHNNTINNTIIRDMNMMRIFNLAQNYSQSLSKDVLEECLEDISDLTKHPDKCQNKFFCKVEKILEKHPNFGSDDEIVQTLAVHNQDHKAICDKVKANKPGSGNEIQLKDFLKYLRDGIQRCFRHGPSHTTGVAAP